MPYFVSSRWTRGVLEVMERVKQRKKEGSEKEGGNTEEPVLEVPCRSAGKPARGLTYRPDPGRGRGQYLFPSKVCRRGGGGIGGYKGGRKPRKGQRTWHLEVVRAGALEPYHSQ